MLNSKPQNLDIHDSIFDILFLTLYETSTDRSLFFDQTGRFGGQRSASGGTPDT